MKKNFPSIAAVDFGSDQVNVLHCAITPSGLEVTGYGQAPSQGIRKGVVINIDAAANCLTEACGQASGLSEKSEDLLVCGVAGSHIQVLASDGMVPIRDREIRKTDVERVLEAASAVSLPLDREVLQVVPQQFIIDGQDGVFQPVGMYAKRLEAQIQLVTGSVTTMQNIRRCLNKSAISVDHFMSTPLAAAKSVLKEEEKTAGVCLLDLGSSTTDLVIYKDGVLKFIGSISVGGMHLTNDLAVALKTNLSVAEQVKKKYGCLSSQPTETVEIPSLNGEGVRKIPRRHLDSVLGARLEEVFHLVRREISKQALEEALPCGIVLTGGGALLKGLSGVAQSSFSMPVRIGNAGKLRGWRELISSPAYSGLAGLVQMGFEESEDLKYFSNFYQKKGLRKIQASLGRWVRDFF